MCLLTGAFHLRSVSRRQLTHLIVLELISTGGLAVGALLAFAPQAIPVLSHGIPAGMDPDCNGYGLLLLGLMISVMATLPLIRSPQRLPP